MTNSRSYWVGTIGTTVMSAVTLVLLHRYDTAWSWLAFGLAFVCAVILTLWLVEWYRREERDD